MSIAPEITIINLTAGWAGIFLGMIVGALMGLKFQNEDWLGGYDSWSRRLLRLGHISFFGLAFINMAFFFTAPLLDNPEFLPWMSGLFLLSAASMPTVCFLSARYKFLRLLFPVPVMSMMAGTILVLGGLLPCISP